MLASPRWFAFLRPQCVSPLAPQACIKGRTEPSFLTLGIRFPPFTVDFFALVDCFIAILTASIIYFGPGFCILRAECLVEPRSRETGPRKVIERWARFTYRLIQKQTAQRKAAKYLIRGN